MSDRPLLEQLGPGGVLTLTMNRPEVHNAFDDQQIKHLTQTLLQAAADDSVRVVVLAGNGKSFSAGGDVNYMRRMGQNSYEENIADASQLADLMKTLDTLPKPTIARVHGAAMGGGVGLVCCCDFAIGSTQAKLALSEVKLGMVPATISPYVINTIGPKAARRLFISGQSVSAEQALSLGLLSDVVAAEALDQAVGSLAEALANNGPNAMLLAKQLCFDIANRPLSEQLIEHSVKAIAEVRDSDEGREGLNAFLEKRKPNWLNSEKKQEQ